MRQRGKKSAAASATVVGIEVANKPRPPENLTDEEKILWWDIVRERDSDFFDAGSLPLLAEYCRLKSQLDQLAGPIADFGSDELRTEPGRKDFRALVLLQEKAQQKLISLGTKMRLTQQSRYHPEKAANRPKQLDGAMPWDRKE